MLNKTKDYDIEKVKRENKKINKKKDLYIGIVIISFVIIVAFFIYLFTYEPPFKDPLEVQKRTVLKIQEINLILTIIVTGVTIIFSKKKENKIRNLFIISMLVLSIIVGIFAIRIYLDNQYNKDKVFEEFYEKYVEKKTDSKKISIGTGGLQLITEQQAYIKDSKRAYKNFQIKTLIYLIIYMLIEVFIFYFINRLSTLEIRKQNLQKDDIIFFNKNTK